MQVNVAEPFCPLVLVNVVVEPLFVTPDWAPQVTPPTVQLSGLFVQLTGGGTEQEEPVALNEYVDVAALHVKLPVPLLVPVAAMLIDAPAAVEPTAPVQELPPTVQLRF